jgi:SagB-type dehydrogenase family enzyme
MAYLPWRFRMRNSQILFLLLSMVVCISPSARCAEKSDKARNPAGETILPAPQTEIGKPLMQALAKRQSNREFDKKDLGLQELSNLLWAADGVNRPDSGKRTAPSAVNWQEIDIYIAKADGLYLYDAKKHSLELILKEDIRALTGSQPFVKDAPINLIFVADFSKMSRGHDENKAAYAAMDTGYISQNVYLYCASEGLSTVVRGSVDKTSLAKTMKLGENQKIIAAQTVGYVKKGG